MSRGTIGRRFLLAAAIALSASGAAHAQLPRQNPANCKGQPELKPLQPLTVTTPKGAFKFSVELADSPREREYGLMCRKALAADRGMLFAFARADYQAFWMRNTLIPLDIIYIGSDGRVVSVVRNAQPLNEAPLPSAAPAQFVLELAAGRAAQIGLLPGDRVQHRVIAGG
ncbi:DUF192 domain-containing protein [Phenylobacterium sp. VNQ135]|uniref:DUF192 domain-containing protein n=1 Tax=Phenylobacterium sp. VNQ135 TaxID=3400922 RepID=UPI003C05BE60